MMLNINPLKINIIKIYNKIVKKSKTKTKKKSS